MTRVQVCGVTSVHDALMCESAGVDAVGLVLIKGRSRSINAEKVKEIVKHLGPLTTSVAIVHNEDIDTISDLVNKTDVDALQLYLSNALDIENLKENGSKIISVILVDSRTGELGYGPETFREIVEVSDLVVFEPTRNGIYGGMGIEYDYEALLHDYCGFCDRFSIAGGLTPYNVEKALKLRPYSVDVSSGVESSIGKKDPTLVQQFIQKCKQQDRRNNL